MVGCIIVVSLKARGLGGQLVPHKTAPYCHPNKKNYNAANHCAMGEPRRIVTSRRMILHWIIKSEVKYIHYILFVADF